jgi:hypothetical protein
MSELVNGGSSPRLAQVTNLGYFSTRERASTRCSGRLEMFGGRSATASHAHDEWRISAIGDFP